ncbi:MAG: rhodanese-like domain-containing protein [Gammaproteobacteria bacterium]|nr:rhodanese-like domain-containing protein [Gammaproteobacteria bacterium]
MFIASFYKFVRLNRLEALRNTIVKTCIEHDVNGTILVAKEGINASMSAQGAEKLERCIEEVRLLLNLAEVHVNWSRSGSTGIVFDRLQVRIRDEIVAFGAKFNFEKPEMIRADSETWTRMLEDPEFLILDVRNEYEFGLGNFVRSSSPKTHSFRQFSKWVERNELELRKQPVGIYCTGGIRCEKAAQFLGDRGIDNVTQLDGGILRYFESKPDSPLWRGECFVFDKRVSLSTDLTEGTATQCHACRHPVTQEERNSTSYEEGISCPRCWSELTEKRRSGLRERARQIKLARGKNQYHVGTRAQRVQVEM